MITLYTHCNPAKKEEKYLNCCLLNWITIMNLLDRKVNKRRNSSLFFQSHQSSQYKAGDPIPYGISYHNHSPELLKSDQVIIIPYRGEIW